MLGIFFITQARGSPPGFRGALLQPLVCGTFQLWREDGCIGQGLCGHRTPSRAGPCQTSWGGGGLPAWASFSLLCASRASQLGLWFPDLRLPELGGQSHGSCSPCWPCCSTCAQATQGPGAPGRVCTVSLPSVPRSSPPCSHGCRSLN